MSTEFEELANKNLEEEKDIEIKPLFEEILSAPDLPAQPESELETQVQGESEPSATQAQDPEKSKPQPEQKSEKKLAAKLKSFEGKTANEILGLKNGANVDEAKQAYLKMVREFHPDKNNANVDAEEITKVILSSVKLIREGQGEEIVIQVPNQQNQPEKETVSTPNTSAKKTAPSFNYSSNSSNSTSWEKVWNDIGEEIAKEEKAKKELKNAEPKIETQKENLKEEEELKKLEELKKEEEELKKKQEELKKQEDSREKGEGQKIPPPCTIGDSSKCLTKDSNHKTIDEFKSELDDLEGKPFIPVGDAKKDNMGNKIQVYADPDDPKNKDKYVTYTTDKSGKTTVTSGKDAEYYVKNAKLDKEGKKIDGHEAIFVKGDKKTTISVGEGVSNLTIDKKEVSPEDLDLNDKKFAQNLNKYRTTAEKSLPNNLTPSASPGKGQNKERGIV